MFKKVFYVNFGYPDNNSTIQMLSYYTRCGADAFVFDLPSRKPFLEKAYIKENMEYIIHSQGVFGVMEGISRFRSKNPTVQISLIVYLDSIFEVGEEFFIEWCKKNSIKHVGIISETPDNVFLTRLRKNGILPNVSAEYSLSAALQEGLSGSELITIQLGKTGTDFRRSFAERLQKVRACAKKNPIFAEMGVQTVDDVLEIKNSGADGAIIGSAAMELWNDVGALENFLKEIGKV